MSQSDFASLAVRNEPADEKYEFDTVHVDSHGAGLIPVNTDVKLAIDEARASFAVAESSKLKTMNVANRMDIEETFMPVPKYVFEPVRCMKNAAPPKIFYRTFWRSVARRILALSN